MSARQLITMTVTWLHLVSPASWNSGRALETWTFHHVLDDCSSLKYYYSMILWSIDRLIDWWWHGWSTIALLVGTTDKHCKNKNNTPRHTRKNTHTDTLPTTNKSFPLPVLRFFCTKPVLFSSARTNQQRPRKKPRTVLLHRPETRVIAGRISSSTWSPRAPSTSRKH